MRRFRYCFGVLALGAMLFAACGKQTEDTPVPTDVPEVTQETEVTPEPTKAPEPTKEPTPTPMGGNLPEGINLLNTYGETFGRIGTCITRSQMGDLTAVNLVKSNYNSITMENEMKPDAILPSSGSSQISVEDAKALGYVIPESYKESTVPELRLSSMDKPLEFCVKHNLGMRAHVLVWHSQTPTWFFREGYELNGAFVTPEVMNARMEFFIRTVMGYIHGSENGHVVYAWDVVNEYVHAENSGWEAVYGDEGLEPSFVKLAFEIADDVLDEYELQDSVSLFYNDFNTYMDTAKIQKLLQFINQDEWICDGVGMQSHLKAMSPNATVFLLTVQKFLDDGYEVQITELDVGNSSDIYQASYLYDIMTGLLEKKKNGAKITGITYWGLSDVSTWRPGEKPLLFRTLSTPKLSYYKVLEAYVDAGLYTEE